MYVEQCSLALGGSIEKDRVIDLMELIFKKNF